MRKGYKRRRGLVALLSAFVLVLLLSFPCFAADDDYTVVVNGTMYLPASVVLSDYFSEIGTYSAETGTYSVYGGTGTLIASNLTGFNIVFNEEANSRYYMLAVPGTEYGLYRTDEGASSYDDVSFSLIGERYLVFTNFSVEYGSELLTFIQSVALSTSNLSYYSNRYTENGIIDVIVNGFNGIITGLGSGVADFFQTLFIANDGTGNLSTFAIVSLVFIGIAAAFGIARWIIKKVGQ